MQQRSDNPILPYVAAAGIILFTPIFFILAVWVYKIVRPHEKIGEVWERNLAEEALLAEVESIHHCPTCEKRIDDEWIICPNCRTRLKRVCPNCSRLVGMDWSLCAWCGKDFERREVPAAAAVEALPRGRDATDRIAASTGDRRRRRVRRVRRDGTAVVRPHARPRATGDDPVDPGVRAGSAARALSSSDPPPDPPSRATAGDSPPGPETLPIAPVLVPAAPVAPPPDAADGAAVAPQPPTSRPGASIFTIEGRAAPGLFVVGWLATLIGVACIIIAVLAGGGTASVVLLVVGLILLSIGLIAAAGSQGIERRARARLPYRGPSPLLVFAAAIPVSALIVVVVAIPLDLLGVPLDGPFGALLSVTIQALVYVALVRLLVVDTGALDWRTMGVGPLGGGAVVEMGRGALWAVPVIAVTAVVSGVLLQVFPVAAGQPACHRPAKPPASRCRCWPGSSSRRSARRSCSGRSRPRRGSAVSATGEAWCWRPWSSPWPTS